MTNLICPVPVGESKFELRVEYESPEVWVWSLRDKTGVKLQGGRTVTRTAAQTEAQRAFEERLHRAGLGTEAPSTYQWQELIA